MRKRLVRKTFDMIQDLSESENKEVKYHQSFLYLWCLIKSLLNPVRACYFIIGLQKILGELW